MTSNITMFSSREHSFEIYHFKNLIKSFPPHLHENTLIGTLLHGTRQMRLPDRDRLITMGQLVVLPPFTTHACSPQASAPSEWLAVQVAPQLLPCSQPLVLDSPDCCLTLAGLAQKICGNADDAAASKKLLAFFAELGHQLPPKAVPDSPAATANQVLTSWMSRSLSGKITLADMAAQCSLNKYAFLRNFQRSTGITPYRYLQSLRIANAQSLLRAGVSPVQCAASSGFCDQSHFNRVFKASIGMTPAAWQNSLPGARS